MTSIVCVKPNQIKVEENKEIKVKKDIRKISA